LLLEIHAGQLFKNHAPAFPRQIRANANLARQKVTEARSKATAAKRFSLKKRGDRGGTVSCTTCPATKEQ
jgi:hypothetical protein